MYMPDPSECRGCPWHQSGDCHHPDLPPWGVLVTKLEKCPKGEGKFGRLVDISGLRARDKNRRGIEK